MSDIRQAGARWHRRRNIIVNVSDPRDTVAAGLRMSLLAPACEMEHEVHGALLDVAEKVFRHIGHQKTTIDDIAAEFGKSRASVYRFFPTRSSINHRVYARWAQRELDLFEQDAGAATPAPAMLANVLTRLSHRVRTRVVSQPNEHALWVVAAREDWQVHHAYFQSLAKGFAAMIGRDADMRHLPDPGVATMAKGVVTAMLAYLHPALVEQRMHSEKDADADLEAHIGFVLKALNSSCRDETRTR
ncbi:TetR/AcrR family transcriptional regulator [Agrobacterium tumefaciens]|nr:TetR/AcrR family transcriptional regulator [Agrobacterium tumefaciens]